MQEIYIASNTGEQPTQQMRKKTCLFNVNSKHKSTLAVTSNRIKRTAKLRPAKHDKHNHNDQDCHNHTDFHICIHIFANTVDRSHSRNNYTGIFQFYKCLILYIERICMYDRSHTSCKKHTCKCYDKWLNIQIRYQKSLYQPKSKTNGKCNQERYKHISALEIQIYRAAHTYKCNDTAD